MVRVVKADLDGLSAAAELVAKGGVICYPTDTVYGLGCDPLNPSAVEKAMNAKGERTKAMPVLVTGLESGERLAYCSERARKLVRRFWPGPLTIVLPAKSQLPSIVAPDRTVGIRSPKHVICQQLLRLSGGFLVGTSANRTGDSPATSAEEVVNKLGERVDMVLDGGRSPAGVPSTVIDLSKDHLIVLREGSISRADVLRCLREDSR